jgi:hypothetical protein
MLAATPPTKPRLFGNAAPSLAVGVTAPPPLSVPAPFVPDNPFVRALQGASGSLVFSLAMALPDWWRSRRLVPPAPVLHTVAEYTAESAAAAFIECSVERVRGRSGDAVAPLIGMVTPRLVATSVRALVAKRKGKPFDWKAAAKQTAATLAFPLAHVLVFRNFT